MNILKGIFELATGRAGGIERFGTAPRDLKVSLYVLMTVPVISALVMAARRGMGAALGILLLLASALMAPAVISHVLARFWGREEFWLRFATAFNWSRMAVVTVFTIMLALTALLIQAGVPDNSAAELMVAAISFYSLWLEWFVARHGLRISAGRAIVAVLAMNGGTFLLLAIPSLISRALMGEAPAG